MNETNPDENFDPESDENSDESRPCPSHGGYSEDDLGLDSRIASENQLYGRWAAEKWLLRAYLRRCCRFLLSKLRPVEPPNSTSDDELPF